MKYSKAYLRARFHKIPNLRFEDQKLTSFAGLVLFQALFARLDLKKRMERCFSHLDSSSSYGVHRIVLLLIVQLVMGFRRLNDVAYYHGGPMVERLVGLRTLPAPSTISRTLADMDATSVEQVRGLSTAIVLQRLEHEDFPRITLDFDGSVLSTKRHAEGSAVGFNKVKKGARSYYPLFCTVAQTGQFFDMHHRPGNVHDSNGAAQFIEQCLGTVRQTSPDAALGAIPTRRLHGNQLYTLCAMTAHNLSRELQMLAQPRRKRSIAKRPAAWTFETLGTLRRRLIQRAGRLVQPQGKLTLTMSANKAVQEDLLHFLDCIKDAA